MTCPLIYKGILGGRLAVNTDARRVSCRRLYALR